MSILSVLLVCAFAQEPAPPPSSAQSPAEPGRVAGQAGDSIRAASPPGPERRRPSVLFWLTDTCRADRTSVHGHGRPTTPFAERLAAEGVVFERCFSQAPWTKPSMASILTSHYPTATGVSGLLDLLDPSFVTLPEALREAGYYTAGFSANIIMGRMSRYEQGFRWFTPTEVDAVLGASGSAGRILPHVDRFLRSREAWPFFLYVHSLDPHEEYRPAPEFLRQFADPDQEARYREQWAALLATQPVSVGNQCGADNFEQAGVDAEEFLAYGRDLYDADVRANDAAMEALFERLAEAHDDLIVVLTSDHGEEFFEHGSTGHGVSLYNESLHVPLILWAPGRLPAGLRFPEPVRSLDIYPTLLDLLDIEAPEGLQGQSLMPWIEAGEATEGRVVFAEMHNDPSFLMFARSPDVQASDLDVGSSLAMIEGPWKFILSLGDRTVVDAPRYQLFHLGKDPAEQHNLAEQSPERVKQYEARVLQWFAANRELRKGANPDQAESLPPHVLDQLRALGYIR